MPHTAPPEDHEATARRKAEDEDQQRRLDEQVTIALDAVAEVKRLVNARKSPVSWEELFDDPRRLA